VNNIIERRWKKVAMAYFKALFRHFLEMEELSG
jgi:hypothetical protein